MNVEFICRKCLNLFEVEIEDVYFDKVRELHFTPEPWCNHCGTTDLMFSDYGAEQIDDLILRNKIRIVK